MFSGQSGRVQGRESPTANGLSILLASIGQLLTGGMDEASEIVLSGDSAGAAAIILQLDRLREQIPAHIPVAGFINGGLFPDIKAADDHEVAREAYAVLHYNCLQWFWSY